MIKRLCAVFLLLCSGLVPAQAQQNSTFKVANRNCVQPGRDVTIDGLGFGRQQRGSIVAVSSGRGISLRISRWNNGRVSARIPRSQQLKAGGTYSLRWMEKNQTIAKLGNVTICGDSKNVANSPTPSKPGPTTRRPSRERADADEVAGPNREPEYIVATPANQAAAASAALQAQGATLLRTRNLNALGQVILVFILPDGLNAQQAQGVLNGAAPGASIDAHNIYGYAQSPRLYAPQMISNSSAPTCKISRSVRVGIIDGPVNPSHPAFKGVSVTRFSALKPGEKRVSPDHGTAVGALIAGSASSGPLSGFAAGSRLYAAEAFSAQRRGTGGSLENIVVGLDWLVGQKVRLVNMSFSGSSNAALRLVVNAAARRGTIMIAASGNNGKSVATYPAGAPEVIAVTAVDASGNLYRKANRGQHIEFAAPGVDVYTAKGGSGGYQTGTSFASPIVTALAARLAARGNLSASSLRSALKRTARDLGPAGRDTKFGWGLVQSGGC